MVKVELLFVVFVIETLYKLELANISDTFPEESTDFHDINVDGIWVVMHVIETGWPSVTP